MKSDLNILISKKSKKIEAGFIVLISIFFLLFFYRILTAQSMFSHDAIRWYGVYHFFADSLLNGVFPYWDPYDYCGQPFYYNLGMLRLYEPITICFIMLYKLFDVSILTIYHWEYMTRIWLVGLGIYLCYRQTNKYLVSNLVVFGAFLFSSFTFMCFRQNGILNTFFWTPWAMYFLLRLLKNFNLYNMTGFSFFVGLSLISYQGIYLLTYLFVFVSTLLINKRGYLISIFKNTKNLGRIFGGIAVMAILALPLFSVYIEQNKIAPIMRFDVNETTVSKEVNLTYDFVKKTGTHSGFIDFSELVFPAAALGYFKGLFHSSRWLKSSECLLYIGIFPFLLAIISIFLSKGGYRINFLLTLILVGLLMLGPRGGIHPVLYFLFYPLRFARHMHLFSGYFIFTLFYFVGQGIDFILDKLSVKLQQG